MAKLSSDKTYVTVEKGDTLSGIASNPNFKPYMASGATYKTLAAINGISNPNLISIGDKIYLKKTSSSSSSSKPTAMTKPTINKFGLQSDSDNTLFATWEWDKSSKTENYKTMWYYATGDGVWFVGSDSTTEYKQSTYSIPQNADKVKFKVKPIAKTVKKNGKDEKQFVEKWSTEKLFIVADSPPEKPSTPSVEITDKNKLNIRVEGIDSRTKQIKFQVVKDDKDVVKTKTIDVTTASASYKPTVDANGTYKVRCRAINKNKVHSDWTDYSNSVVSYPSAPKEIEKLEAKSDYSVRIQWTKVSTAKSYTIQYTQKKGYFDSSPDNVSSKTITSALHAEITGLESGKEYFCRVCATNEQGDSGWTAIKSVVVGKAPSIPTTWSSTTTAIAEEDLYLYWAHNSEDGSKQRSAKVYLTAENIPLSDCYVNGVLSAAILRNSVIGMKYTDTAGNSYKVTDSMVNVGTAKRDGDTQYAILSTVVTLTYNNADDTTAEKTTSLAVNTSVFKEGATIRWYVQTKGIHASFSESSTAKEINIYAQPTLDVIVTDVNGNALDTLTSFPLYIRAVPGPDTQAPIGYHVDIIANSGYQTVDAVGNEMFVSKGDSVYSNFFDISNQVLTLELSAHHLDLENGVSYTIDVTATMDSGLTVSLYNEDPKLDERPVFDVAWTDEEYAPNARISIDPVDLTATINPYCEAREIAYHVVTLNSGVYTKTTETVDSVYGELVEGAATATGEEVYYGSDDEGNDIYYCEVETITEINDITMSVYRREYDGRFVEIQTGITDNITNVPDPHPALDFARYRIVAISNTTGSVSFTDLPGEPVGESAVIIQWAEEWSSYNTFNEDELAEPEFTASMLRLPYNIDVSDSNDPDVSLVEYVGRSHPVTYYGTQLGEKSTWSTEIPKTDVETLYALRRLRNWMGDVYVREPSGSGYWANIKVKYDLKHKDLTIPVTFDVTRVEGGM